MAKYIVQHSTPDLEPLLEISSKTNKAYAEKYGFNYVKDVSIASPDKGVKWEKLAFLNKWLPTIEDGALVICEDSCCLNIGSIDATSVLAEGDDTAMVPIVGGAGNKTAHPTRKNTGVIFFKNIKKIRDMFIRIYASDVDTDGTGFSNEFKKNEIKCAALDPKWNCWNGNPHLCKEPVIIGFYSNLSVQEKSDLMKASLEG